ncbi:MAG: NADH-ubiquinone oxidoreductase-F iron-sulfur binding region domain-containing protein, partial [Candidatus Desantisbacteria bacterium]
KSRDAVETAFKTMEFFYDECCGKCAPCREGTRVMLEILERFNNKKATETDIKNLQALSDTMNITSLCGLGQTAPNVVVDTLKNYKQEYIAGPYA